MVNVGIVERSERAAPASLKSRALLGEGCVAAAAIRRSQPAPHTPQRELRLSWEAANASQLGIFRMPAPYQPRECIPVNENNSLPRFPAISGFCLR